MTSRPASGPVLTLIRRASGDSAHRTCRAVGGADAASRRSEGGFTLIEVMVVLTILGLVMGLVLAHGPLRSHTLEVRSVAASVARMLRTARGQAIATDRPTEVVVDLRHHAMRLGPASAQKLPPGLAVTVATGAEQTVRGLVAGFRFEPDGSASGGHIDLQDPGGLRIRIGVDWLTGRISVADLPPGTPPA